MSSERVRVTRRRAYDVIIGYGNRLGFVVQLPDNIARHRREWVAYECTGAREAATYVGAYAKPRDATDAIRDRSGR